MELHFLPVFDHHQESQKMLQRNVFKLLHYSNQGFCQNLECHVVIFWYPCSYLRAPVFTFQGNYGLKILPMKSTGKFDKLKLLGKNMNKS